MSASSSNQPAKLRDLIKNIRGCKTAAEERALVQREKANIRESFNQGQEEYRPRNVAKLLFISMLGHDTDFGQMECLKLITKSSFIEKRIGYLGLTQLFHEKSEVLMMATHRIHTDLNSQSNYVISLALMALSEICTAEMCRELVGDLVKLMKNGTSFVKKKAALAATKIIKKLPETTADFASQIESLIEDRHHGVLLSTLGLVEEILNQDRKYVTQFTKFFVPMLRVLKGLVANYSAEFDIQGISDPFLQIQILKFISQMAKGNQSLSEDVSEILAQVAQNTSSAKNTGNAVLYECVRTIFEIESAASLKTLAINLLGKFLQLKDNNSKYLSLYMLKKVLVHDMNSVQKHKQIIMDCLKEKDLSIKQLALDLTYMITNESNVKQIIKELLNYLLTNQEPEFMQELTLKICGIVDKHSPNRKWHMDTIIKVLTLAGNFIKEESISSLIHLVCSTPELQTYALQKLYYSLLENVNQGGLAKAALYLLGEFALLLTQPKVPQETVTETDIINLIKQVHQKPNCEHSIKEYGLNSLIKLYTKFQTGQDEIKQLIENEVTSSSSEVQKRACEYLQLINEKWEKDRTAICEVIPEFQPALEQFKDKPLDENGEMSVQEDFGRRNISLGGFENAGGANAKSKQTTGGIIDIGNIIDFDNSPKGNQVNLGVGFQQQKQQPQQQAFSIDDVFNIVGDSLGGQKQSAVPPVNTQTNFNNSSNSLGFDLFGGVTASSSQQSRFEAFKDQNISIDFQCTQNNNITNIVAYFSNRGQSVLTDVSLQVAVVKYLKPNLNPMSSSTIQVGSINQVTQSFSIENTLHGQKPVMLKLKVLYSAFGKKNEADVTLKDQFNFISGVSAPAQQQIQQQVIQPIIQPVQQPIIQPVQQPIIQPIQQQTSQVPDLFGGILFDTQPTQNNPSQNTGLFNIGGNTPQNPTHQFVFTSLPSVDLDFNCQLEGDTTVVTVRFKNKTFNQLSGFNFSVAVQKHCKCTLGVISSDVLLPQQSNITQQFRVQNTLQGQKGIALRIRVQFSNNGQQVVEQETVNGIPQNW